jgi:hypothetical protein
MGENNKQCYTKKKLLLTSKGEYDMIKMDIVVIEGKILHYDESYKFVANAMVFKKMFQKCLPSPYWSSTASIIFNA